MPTPETFNAIYMMAAGGGLVFLGLVGAKLLFRPHYVATERVQVLQGVNQRIEAPIVEPVESSGHQSDA